MQRLLWNLLLGRLYNQYIRELDRAVGDSCKSLLDVGCGHNSPVQYLKNRPLHLVGVEAFLPAIEQSCAKGIHDVYHHSSILDILKTFGPESYESVLASDVIEHLTREDALNLIFQMEKVAQKKIIIFTPNGFLPQGEEFGNPLQKHLSGWSPRVMRSLGYSIIGIKGLRPLRGEMGRIRWHPRKLWAAVALLSQPFTRNLPSLAFSILGVKEK